MAEARGRLEGVRNANLETAKKVIALGKLSLEDIASIYNLTPEEVMKLAEES